ncbi:MAG: hypothetical protein JKY31_02890 [Rhodobacteraceae bacterium]|nr:hypothetical protein [Paracoccaceae bacterium]
MNRTDLTLIFVSTVVVALVLGWCARWMFDRLNHEPHPPEFGDDEDPLLLAQTAQAKAESELSRIQSEYASEYNQLKAELGATMDGLGLARQKSDALQAEIKTLKQSNSAEDINDDMPDEKS